MSARDGLPFFVYACDISPRAIDILRQDPELSRWCHAFVCDITQPGQLLLQLKVSTAKVIESGASDCNLHLKNHSVAPNVDAADSLDIGLQSVLPPINPLSPPKWFKIVSMVFVLSAIPAEKMQIALQNVARYALFGELGVASSTCYVPCPPLDFLI
ncbi:unnamed protein product [Protopolystoma xenopodis]|uniref:Uncharacterized protein n=1 Tax=Protopolystoma xenopodis TaxID=117903 RepID=A0A448XBM7_9PLAT|nr:unnamed protein product [Protopolystoma xenopodis]